MPKTAFIATALALVVAHDIKSHRKHRKNLHTANEAFDLMIKANDALLQEWKNSHAQVAYLLHKLDETGTEPDEFDLIALNFNSK
jgi:hypothetical protein